MTLDEVLALESDWNVIIPMEKDRFCEIDEYLELVKNRTGEEKEQSQAEYLADYRNIVDYDTKEYSIQDLLKKFENNSIELSNLGRIDEFNFIDIIEYLLLGVPMDDIMFKLEDDVMKITHNGDIINILHLFFENKFKLEGLNVLTKFEGMCFDDFDPSTKRKLSIKTLRMKHIISDKYNLLSQGYVLAHIRRTKIDGVDQYILTLNDAEIKTLQSRGVKYYINPDKYLLSETFKYDIYKWSIYVIMEKDKTGEYPCFGMCGDYTFGKMPGYYKKSLTRGHLKKSLVIYKKLLNTYNFTLDE